jgi:hypothetical protein
LETVSIIRRSHSLWSSALHMVHKLDCLRQLSRLNMATEHDRYLLPSLADYSNNLHVYKFFMKIDIVKGYHEAL